MLLRETNHNAIDARLSCENCVKNGLSLVRGEALKSENANKLALYCINQIPNRADKINAVL